MAGALTVVGGGVAAGAPALSVSLLESGADGYIYGPGTAAAGPAQALPVGGVAPYTYSWTKQLGDTTVYAYNDDTATPSFYASLSEGNSASAVYVCTVTDAASTVVESGEFFVALYSYTEEDW